jgi:cobalt-zinc-cadmium efflux system protein
MSHNHNHSHHKPSNIGIAFLLNFSFSIIEIIGGILTNSTAILSDAVHDLGDSLSLAFSLFAEKASKKDKTDQYTYGFKRFSLIGALVNIIVLLVGTAYVLREAIEALFNPQAVHSEGMLLLAILGIAVNGFSVLRMKGSNKILDKSVVMHLLEDLLGWFAVLIVSIVITFTEWYVLDPILSIFIAFIVLRNICYNGKEAYKILMQAVPDEALYQHIREHILDINEVKSIDHMNMWTLDGEEHVVTMVIKIEGNVLAEALRRKLKAILIDEGINKSNVEIVIEGK